jgi:2',3'-cyclic-nucleotide 2'-phosphodiesterase (5'-nucleotidase family)
VGGRVLTPSAEAVALIEAAEAEAGSLCDAVGCDATALHRSREAESGVGDMVADAMRAAFPDADVALTNSGGLRDDLPAGTVRRQDLQEIMPFDNRVLKVPMTGAQLLLLLRLGTSGGHGILQVSGVALTMDPEASGGTDLDGDGAVADWERDRLCAATVGGAPIDPAATYDVVTTDFLANGGDHMALAFDGAGAPEQGPLLRDWLFTWVAAQKGCIGAAPLPDPERPRIVRAAGCKAGR